VIFSLAIVIVAIFILRFAARRFLRLPGAAASTDAIRVLSRTPISPKQHVLALAVGRRVLIVADNGQQLSTLCELTDPRELRDFTGHTQLETLADTEASAETEASPETDDPPRAQAPPRPQPTVILSPRHELQGLLSKVKGLSQQFK
jgi:flagellar biogenesis protein FliO